jgi:hypothetical protein
MNLLVLVMEFIVMSENISIRMTFARSNNRNEFAELHNSIGHELMELHTKFVKYIQKHRVRRYAKASNEKKSSNTTASFSMETGTNSMSSGRAKPFGRKRKEFSGSEMRPLVTFDCSKS